MERLETGTSERVGLTTELETLRLAADHALSRTAGAPLVGGNSVRVLRDAAENFPAWRAAISAAERSILFECYIFHDDEVGREFVAALVERVRAGVSSGRVARGRCSGRSWRRAARCAASTRRAWMTRSAGSPATTAR